VIAKTNLHEFAYGVTSENPWFGPVLQPSDPSRIAGGSSGGSAVAVALGLCDWAVGTDTGGSIRIPAALCGVFGLKTTWGLLPMAGIRPLAPTLDTVGPLAATLSGIESALEDLLGPEPAAAKLSISRAARFGPGRVAVPRGWVSELEPGCQPVWAALSDGRPEVDFATALEVNPVARTILLAEAARQIPDSLGDRRDPASREMAELLAEGRELTAQAYQNALTERLGLIDRFADLMGDLDALLLPTTGCRAPLRGSPASARAQLTRYTRLANLLGAPALSIPVPVAGLPFGVQLIGRPGADRALIGLAGELLDGLGAGQLGV
jgi:aspartyl-tRNA(Asn)/glutamyl-tRNA(Gln) amidotransferase subunit A